MKLIPLLGNGIPSRYLLKDYEKMYDTDDSVSCHYTVAFLIKRSLFITKFHLISFVQGEREMERKR